MRDQELATLFEKEIARRSQEMSVRHEISAELLRHVLTQTAVLDETGDPQDIQFKKIRQNGFTDDDLYFAPSLEEAIEVIGKDSAIKLFSERLSELIVCQKTYQFIFNGPPPILTNTEWSQVIGKYIKFLNKEKKALSESGQPSKLPEVSCLLRSLPKAFLLDTNDIILCANEIKGKSLDELNAIAKFSFEDYSGLEERDGDLKGLVGSAPVFRKKLVQIFIEAFELLYQKHPSQQVTFAKSIADLIFKHFKRLQDLNDVKDVERVCLGHYDGSNSHEFEKNELGEWIKVGIAPSDIFILPKVFQDLIETISLIHCEFEFQTMATLRSLAIQRTRITSLSFPLLNEFEFWNSDPAVMESNFQLLKSVFSAFQEIDKHTTAFLFECASHLNNCYSASISVQPSPAKKLVQDVVQVLPTPQTFKPVPKNKNDIKDDYDDSDKYEAEFKLGKSDYIFTHNFERLKWKNKIWDFKPWEAEILKGFYEAYKNKLDFDGREIDKITYESYYKDHIKDFNNKLQKEIDSGKKSKKKPKQRAKQYYIFQYAFHEHPDLKQTFIKSSPTLGFYKLDPEWIPESKSKKESSSNRKKRLAKRSPILKPNRD